MMRRCGMCIVGCLLFIYVSAETRYCEKLFIESLKEVYVRHVEKFRKKAGKVYKRQTHLHVDIDSRNIILIPVVYYTEEIQQKKNISLDEYFCVVDCRSMQFNSSLILTQNDIFVVMPSVTKKYILLPYTHSQSVRRLVSEIQRIRPDLIFTVCNADTIFFVKGEQVLVFDTKEGIIVERAPALLRIISDPLRLRYVKHS